MRLLVVNADDFGLNDAATDGILQSFLAGSVTSTTLMVNASATERAIDLAKRHPELGVGLHFNLTWGKPVSRAREVSALVDGSGRFLSRSALAWRLVAGRVPQSQIMGELEAQYDRMTERGLLPTHVDSHQHIHGFAEVFSCVASLCEREAIPMRVPWVAAADSGGVGRRIRRAVLRRMLEGSIRRWQGKVRWNDGLGSVFDVGAEEAELSDAHYRFILQQAQGQIFELMVHPVTDVREMDGYTRIGSTGKLEFDYLVRGSLPALAREEGFTLGTFRNLAMCI